MLLSRRLFLFLSKLSSERFPLAVDGSGYQDPQPDIMWRESLSWSSPSGLSPSRLGELHEEGDKRWLTSERMDDTRGAWLSESIKQGSYELRETEVAITGCAWVCTRSFVYML